MDRVKACFYINSTNLFWNCSHPSVHLSNQSSTYLFNHCIPVLMYVPLYMFSGSGSFVWSWCFSILWTTVAKPRSCSGERSTTRSFRSSRPTRRWEVLYLGKYLAFVFAFSTTWQPHGQLKYWLSCPWNYFVIEVQKKKCKSCKMYLSFLVISFYCPN